MSVVFLERQKEKQFFISIMCLIQLKSCNGKKLRSSHQKFPVRKGVLRNFAKFKGKHLYQSFFFNKVAGLRPATLFKKETLAQVFSCEFSEIFKNAFFQRTPPVAASEIRKTTLSLLLTLLCLHFPLNFRRRH